MRRILAVSICFVSILLVTSCSDPNEDVFHEIGKDSLEYETGTGDADGREHDTPPPGGN